MRRIPQLLTTTLQQQIRRCPRIVAPFISRSPPTRLLSSSAAMKFPTPSEDPPKHEMAYFPDMTTSLPSQSGDFRRVLWTGLYSQLVLMTVPVGGDIGDEVTWNPSYVSIHHIVLTLLHRNIPSTRFSPSPPAPAAPPSRARTKT
jgi:hypothetical protein